MFSDLLTGLTAQSLLHRHQFDFYNNPGDVGAAVQTVTTPDVCHQLLVIDEMSAQFRSV